METKMTKTMMIGASLLALSLGTSATFAGFGDIFNPNGGSGGGPVDIGDVFNNTTDDDEADPWDEIFNPQPEAAPVINKKIDIFKPFPDLNLDFSDGTPPGTMVDYAKVAKLNVNFGLSCAVAGTPSEFPNDVVIANTGLIAVPAHAIIQWQVKATGETGITSLTKTLKPGKSIKLSNVLKGGVEAGTPCAITAIGQ
jgi:hypothetical protein